MDIFDKFLREEYPQNNDNEKIIDLSDRNQYPASVLFMAWTANTR